MKTVLIVDDSPTIQRTISFMLRRMGHAAVMANNGVEALDQLQNNLVDVIITDIIMPEMDGLTLMETVRQQAALRHIPVILLTESGEWQQDKRSQKADGVLTKPVSSHQLMGKIASLFP